MAFFKKKEEPFDENSPEARKITRKLKDLNPENKKKRKEPPKPWGKRERMVVLIILLVTTIIAAILLVRTSILHTPGSLEFHLPKFDLDSINLFKGETIVIESN